MSSGPFHRNQEFLKQVIDMAFQYLEHSTTPPNASDFAGFIGGHSAHKKNNDEIVSGAYEVSAADYLGIQLVLLNRYAKEYVKVALADTQLQTADEFPFLMALFAGGSHIKTELFDKMLLTKTTGTEILKRLGRKGLIVEHADSHDKRSKRVHLSDQGRKLVMELLPRMSGVSKLISGNLTATELGSLNYLLKKLSNHHRKFFAERSNEELQDLIRK